MNRKKLIIGALIVVAGGALVAANVYFKREKGVEVQVEKIKKHDLESIVSASGKIQARTTVNISSQSMGRVTKLAVEEGDRVKEGQFLLEIDPRSLRTQVERGEAGLSAQRTAVAQARVQLESAKASLKLAQDTYKRQQDLWKDQLTTKQDLDRAENDVKLRERDVEAREAAITMESTRVRQTTADLDNARYNLGQVSIDSPIDGIVTRRNIELGENVMIGTMNNAGTVLLTIADMSIIEAELEVDETDIPNLQMGQTAKVTIDAIPDKTFTAKVTEIGNSPIQATAAAATRATNFKVVVTLDGRDPRGAARVHLHGRHHDGHAQGRGRDPDPGDDRAGARLRREGQRREGARGRQEEAAAAGRGGRRRAQARARRRRKPRACSSSRTGRRAFLPVKTGIAGEKFLEVLSGVKDGDEVIVGPFNSVRDLKDGDAVKLQAAGKK